MLTPTPDTEPPQTTEPPQHHPRPGERPLTARELAVAIALAEGQTNREIARALGCAVKTIDTHRQHVMKKLNIRGNVQLVYYALRAGWVSL